MKRSDFTDVRNTVIVALGLWAVAVAEGTRVGVFGRLPDEVISALALFAAVFAVMAVTLDESLRAWLEGRGTASSWIVVLGIDAVMAAAGLAFAGDPSAHVPVLARWAPILLFGAPVTVAFAVCTARAARAKSGEALRRPESKAPARRTIAT